jgi:hypothetical protein
VQQERLKCRTQPSSRRQRDACTSSTPRQRVSRCVALRCSGGASAAWRRVAVPPPCAAACGGTSDELRRAAGVPRRHGPAVRRARFYTSYFCTFILSTLSGSVAEQWLSDGQRRLPDTHAWKIRLGISSVVVVWKIRDGRVRDAGNGRARSRRARLVIS